MAKIFAVTIILIAIASAIPILRHTWVAPEDISTHGGMIDEQMSETMAEAGISFLAAQFVLAIFVWMFSGRDKDAKITTFPGGATGLVVAAFLLVGTEVLALGVFGVKAWADVYLTPPSASAMPVQVQAGQFAFYFRYPGPDGTFGPLHPEQISESNENFFGLDTAHDPDSKDNIVTAEMAIPVNSPHPAHFSADSPRWASIHRAPDRAADSQRSSPVVRNASTKNIAGAAVPQPRPGSTSAQTPG